MLTINEFKKEIEKNFKDYLKPMFQDREMKFSPVIKTNCKKTGISLIQEHHNNEISCTIYLEDMYEYYQKNGDLDETFTSFAECIKNGPKLQKDYSDFFSAEYILDHVFIQLINQSKNTELLTQVPHEDFLDLAAVFRVQVVLDDDKQSASYLLTHENMKVFNLDFDSIKQKAYENYVRILGQFRVTSIEEFIPEIDQLYNVDFTEPSMHIVLNKSQSYGAAAMLVCPELFRTISTQLDSDLIILPSSIHELIIVGADISTKTEHLYEIVHSVNQECVEEKDFLSDTVYTYSIEHGFDILNNNY